MNVTAIQDWQVLQPTTGGWPLHLPGEDGAPLCGNTLTPLRRVSWRLDKCGLWCVACFKACAALSDSGPSKESG